MRVSLMMAVASISLASVACGSSDDSGIPDGGGDVIKVDAAKDSTVGDAAKDTATTDTTMDMNTPDVISDTTTDTPAADTGACTMVAKKDCTTCCGMAYKKGAKELLAAELSCACTMFEDAGKAPTLCGPYDAGTPDSSALGEGACNAAMCSADAGAPDKDCRACLREATGTMAKPGQCYSTVAAACTSGSCVDYVGCLAACE